MNGFPMCNQSLLTSDMWAVTVHALEFHEPVDSLDFVAFGLVVVGLVVREASTFASSLPREKYKQVDQVDVTVDALVGGAGLLI